MSAFLCSYPLWMFRGWGSTASPSHELQVLSAGCWKQLLSGFCFKNKTVKPKKEVSKHKSVNITVLQKFYRINVLRFLRAPLWIQDYRTADPASPLSFRDFYLTCKYSLQEPYTAMLPQPVPAHSVPFAGDLM